MCHFLTIAFFMGFFLFFFFSFNFRSHTFFYGETFRSEALMIIITTRLYSNTPTLRSKRWCATVKEELFIINIAAPMHYTRISFSRLRAAAVPEIFRRKCNLLFHFKQKTPVVIVSSGSGVGNGRKKNFLAV